MGSIVVAGKERNKEGRTQLVTVFDPEKPIPPANPRAVLGRHRAGSPRFRDQCPLLGIVCVAAFIPPAFHGLDLGDGGVGGL